MNLDECRPGVEVILGEHTHRQGWGAGMNDFIGTKTRLKRRCSGVSKPAWYVEGNDFYWYISNLICVDTEPTEEVVLSITRVHEILESHQRWFVNNDHGRQADLRKVNLSGFDLRGYNLYEAILCNANLSGANLSKSVFLNAHLEGVNFTEANLSDTNLDQAKLAGSVFTKANCRGSSLHNNTFKGIDLQGADFSESTIRECGFYNSNLSFVKFNWAKIVSCSMETNNMLHTSFFEAILPLGFQNRLSRNTGYMSVDFRGARYEY